MRVPKSPYQKYNKSEYPYSEHYLEWKAEVKKNGACGSKALSLACRHAALFGVKRKDCER